MSKKNISAMSKGESEELIADLHEVELSKIPPNACKFCNLVENLEQGEIQCYCYRCDIRAHIGCVMHATLDCRTDTIVCKSCGKAARIQFDKRNCTRFLSSIFFLLRRTQSILLWTPVVLGLITLLGYILRVSLVTNKAEPDFWLPSSVDFLVGLSILPAVALVIGLTRSQTVRKFFCGCCYWLCCQNKRLVRRR